MLLRKMPRRTISRSAVTSYFALIISIHLTSTIDQRGRGRQQRPGAPVAGGGDQDGEAADAEQDRAPPGERAAEPAAERGAEAVLQRVRSSFASPRPSGSATPAWTVTKEAGFDRPVRPTASGSSVARAASSSVIRAIWSRVNRHRACRAAGSRS